MQDEQRVMRVSRHHLELSPRDAAGEIVSRQRREGRLFRGHTCGELSHRFRMGAGILTLADCKHPFQGAVTLRIEQTAHPLYLHEIDADADDHASRRPTRGACGRSANTTASARQLWSAAMNTSRNCATHADQATSPARPM